MLGRTLSLSAKTALMVVGSVALLTAALLTAAFILMTNEAKARAVDAQETNMKVAWAILGGYGQGFSVQDGRLLAGNTVLNANNAPVDRIKTLVDGTASIFLGDVRVATNVIKPDDVTPVSHPAITRVLC